jgi:hypothetical protein
MTISDDLRTRCRRRVDASGLNQFARDSGIDPAVVCRFLGGSAPSGSTTDRLAAHLKLRLAARGSRSQTHAT